MRVFRQHLFIKHKVIVSCFSSLEIFGGFAGSSVGNKGDIYQNLNSTATLPNQVISTEILNFVLMRAVKLFV